MTDIFSKKITFTGTGLDRSLVLLLAFDFAKSHVQPPPSRLEKQYPVVWKIKKFDKSPPNQVVTTTHDVTYTNQLAFTKSELLPQVGDEVREILSPQPKLVQEVNAQQETMLVQDPNKPEIYSFVPPINLGYDSSVAMNGVATGLADIAFGFFETLSKPPGSKPAQILSFHDILPYMPVGLEFAPILQVYFVPEGFYAEGEILSMPIPSPLVREIDIRSDKADYSISIVDNRATIN